MSGVFFWAGVVGCAAVACSLAVFVVCGLVVWREWRAQRRAEARMVAVLHRDRARIGRPL